MKKLLILTGTYPYGPLDHFVESDLPELTKHFKIDILPQNSCEDNTPTHATYADSINFHPGVFNPSTIKEKKGLFKSLVYLLCSPIFACKLTFSFLYELGFLFVFDKEQSLFFTIIRKFIKRPRPKTALKVRLRSLVETSGFLILANYSLRKFNFSKYDLIYSYWGHELALITAFKTRKKMICRLHGYDLYKERRKDMYFAHRNYFLFKLKRIICISYIGKTYLEQNFPFLRKSKVSVSYIGSTLPDKTLQVLPHKEEITKVLTCSRIHPVKQIHLMIKALNAVNANIEWHHIGDGPEKETKALESLITALGLDKKKNISYTFHGHVKSSDVLKTISALKPDLFINCSKSEGLPISILEVMSIGIPVLAPNIGGIREAVYDQENGYLLPERVTSNRIRETLERFSETSLEQRILFSQKSLEIWTENFNSNQCAQSFYKEVSKIKY